MSNRPKSDNFYERLDVVGNASKEDIKKAFFKAVKIYPPEKDPENYKLIREAYNTLYNHISREEYDSNRQFGEELRKLFENIKNARKESNQGETIRLYKKVVNLIPNGGIHRNSLGLLFFENSDFNSAKKHFEKACMIDPQNPTYIINLADTEAKMGNYLAAENNYKKAWGLDKQDYVAPRRLAELYFYEMGKKPEAYEVLDKAIGADDKVDFQDFFCLYDKLHFLLLDKKDSDMTAHLELLVSIAKRKEERDFAAYTLSESCEALAKRGQFTIAFKFIDAAKEMSSDDWIIKTNKHLREYVVFDADGGIAKEVKGLVSLCYHWYWGAIEKKNFDEYIESLKEAVITGLSTRPISKGVKNSFTKLKEVYPEVYKIQQKFYDSILNNSSSVDTHYRGPCPRCNKDVVTLLHQAASYTCPHCSGHFYSTGSSYETSAKLTWEAWSGRIIIGIVVLIIMIASAMDDTSTTSQKPTMTYSKPPSNYTYLQNLKKTIDDQAAQIEKADSYLSTLQAKINYYDNTYKYTRIIPQHVIDDYNSKIDEYNNLVAMRNRVYSSYSANIEKYNSSISK